MVFFGDLGINIAILKKTTNKGTNFEILKLIEIVEIIISK